LVERKKNEPAHSKGSFNLKIWNNNNRKQKAINKGLSQNEIYTLASIVEEETNYDSDKKLIASVYQNRLKKSMPLQACPTIKYGYTLTNMIGCIYVAKLIHLKPFVPVIKCVYFG
jgi:UPF0755 protein